MCTLTLIAGFLATSPELGAQAAAGPELIVGTKEAPPFAIQNPDGTWSGISIELWENIADSLDFDYEFRQLSLEGLFEGLKNGSIAVAVAALTVTPEREEIVDFTHPFHTSGLAIATVPRKRRWISVLRQFFSWTFAKVVFGLILILLVAGTLMWLFERRHNTAQFGGSARKGLGDGFWWSAVTVTTVGYGDKAPKTVGGRVVALIWMFAGIALISAFTAALASALTTAGLESHIRGPEDLPGVRVATVSGTTSETYLQHQHSRFKVYSSATDALKAVVSGKADAAVYDAPILRYLVKHEYEDTLLVLPRKFERQDYSFGLPPGSLLREKINRELLRRINEASWQDTLYKYLGSQ